jgi:hypothetical protein
MDTTDMRQVRFVTPLSKFFEDLGDFSFRLFSRSIQCYSYLVTIVEKATAKDPELEFLYGSLIIGAVLSKKRPSPSTMPDINKYAPGHSVHKFKFGGDSVVFLLKDGDPFLKLLRAVEDRPLDMPNFVEVRPSPIDGLGLFTTKDCSPGDLLLTERLLVSWRML